MRRAAEGSVPACALEDEECAPPPARLPALALSNPPFPPDPHPHPPTPPHPPHPPCREHLDVMFGP